MAKKWIKEATAHDKGSLHRWAVRHRLLTENGDINLIRAQEYLNRHYNLHRQRQLNLAKNLRHVNHRRRE